MNGSLPSPAAQSAPSAPTSGSPETLLPSVVLDRAADLIEPEGRWTNDGDYWNGDDGNPECFCALGAIWFVCDPPGFVGDVENGPAARMLARSLGLPGTLHIAKWNDHLGRTQAEVVAALRKAAELARSEGQ